jgi:uncharacterized protein
VADARRLAGGLAAAGAAALAWGGLVERRWYAVRREVLPVLRPSATGPLRVLLFADLHLVPGQDHRLDVVRRTAREAAPDVVVSAGDNLEHPRAVEAVVALHRDVLADTGAVGLAVLGAHDRWGPRPSNPAQYLRGPSAGPRGAPLDTPRLVAGLEGAGWRVLVNARERVTTPAGPVDVVGLDDPHADLDDASALGPPPDGDVALRLGLVHAPYRRALEALERAGADLALAGHTHGGQLAVPGWGALVTNCDLPAAQARGTSWAGLDLRLHVTAGLGHSVWFPVRFACRPELSVLDLVPRSAP